MRSTTLDTIWVPAPKIAAVAAESAERLALMPLESGRPVILTDTALRIWNLLDERTSFRELLARLSTEFEVDQDAIRPEVERFVADLQRQHLIVPFVLASPGT